MFGSFVQNISKSGNQILQQATRQTAILPIRPFSMSSADMTSYSNVPMSQPLKFKRPRLVILGTGWGSYSVLKKIDKSQYDVIVVSPRNHFLFTPLLCSTTVGTLEFRSVVEPVRNTGFRKTDHFNLCLAKSVDFDNKTLCVESVLKPDTFYELDYDKLVIGVGALSNTFGTPGVHENAFFLKEVADARNIRNRILANFELATQQAITEAERRRLLHVVIVGGGPTGIEFGAEIYDFIEQDVNRLYQANKGKVRVTLVEFNKILAMFDERLRNYAEKKLNERKGFNLLQDMVTGVHSDHITLKETGRLDCGLVVWSTGLAPRPFVFDMDVPKNKMGQILTDRQLRVLGDPSGSTFALGDCADIQDYSLPCTAQVAERQGRYLAEQLNNPDVKDFTFTSQGTLAYIGSNKALSDLPDVKLRGIPSWILWRSAYLTRLSSIRCRLQVLLDWMKTFLFGRDITKLE